MRVYLDAQKLRQDGNGKQSPLLVCPGCDGRPPSVSDGKIHEDLDHFFPKSRYPLLAIHLLNLTPFCKDCNQTYKGSKDAIGDEDALVADVLCLHDIFHPYLRPAQPATEVVVARDEAGEPHLHLHCRHNDARQLAWLHSLLYTLNVNGRWDGELSEGRLRSKLEMLLFHRLQSEHQVGWQLDEVVIREHLETAVATLSHFVGSEPGNVAVLAYARWLASDEAAQREWVGVKTAVFVSSP
jgi:hypothetical protein